MTYPNGDEKRLEEALRASQQRYENIFRHSAISLWEEDISELRSALKTVAAQGISDVRKHIEENPRFLQDAIRSIRVVDVNDATLRLYEAERKEQLLGPLDITLDPEAISNFSDLILAIAEGQRYHRKESTARTLRGRKLDIDVFQYIPAESDLSPCMIVNVIDISERKRAERELMEEKMFSDAIIACAPGIFYVIDETGHFVRWNRNEEEVTGYSREELRRLHALATIVPEDRESITLAMKETLEKGSAVREARGLGKAGKVLPYLFTGVRADIGDRKFIVGMGFDLTERKRAEEERRSLSEQLAQFQKMESIGRLAGGIAHDFNNLLTGIIGNTSLALAGLDRHDPLFDILSDADKTAQSAKELTRQLLAFSRKETVEPKVIDLNVLIKSMLRMLQRIIGGDIDLRAVHQEDLWSVRADPGQVNQIVVNLAVNARDAMAGGGRLTIESKNVTLGGAEHGTPAMTDPGDYVMLEVTDTGSGMTDEVKSHIFEPFYTTKEKGMGTGLGLAMVYGAVRQNRGVIEVDSERGRGTRFRIYFPRSVDLP
jgi:PAS domain S-box-containing protein